ncbi:MAG: hypothetical protein HY805_09555 [Nitrospirae bacterium]|nr:hypothetical protein [Nitrospirota bacterium]
MPKSWRLLASNDGINWVEIDRQINQTDWKYKSFKAYTLKNPVEYKIYRFIFEEGNSNILHLYNIRLLPENQ